MSLTKDASSETDASFCIGHFNPLDVVTIERTNWNKADVMLFTTDDDQQLLFWQIINLVDAFALTDPSDFYSENNNKKEKFEIKSTGTSSNEQLVYLHDRGRYKVILLQCRWLNGRYQ